VSNFKLRDRKFEWQAGANIHTVWDTSIQLRQSGIRFKKPDFFPALVAIVQTPIVAKYKRRITPKEAAKLQSFPNDFKIHKNDHIAYRQFGNSVNVKMVTLLAKWLFDEFK
jgi:DNA (cytosine-5)-methyltransferase 1